MGEEAGGKKQVIFNNHSGDRVFVSWSGGKDSYLSLLMAQEQGLEIACLLSFVGGDGYSRSHGLKTEMLHQQAAALGLPLHTEEVTWESYEVGFERAVKMLKEKYALSGGVFGDINLEEHRQWIEKMTDRCGIDYNLPLWLMEERAVSEELIRRGGKALIVAIRNDLLDQKWLGRVMDNDYIEHCVSIGISPCGEGGEAHTLVIDGPCFTKHLAYQAGSVRTKDNHSRLELLVD
jgi:diphthine-ammonia ligase